MSSRTMLTLLHRDGIRWTQAAMMLVLLGSVMWFVARTLPWPLTGDASLMHYVTFLIDHGRAPYKDIGDLNLPLSYAPQWMVSRLFGAGDLPWRIYDLALLALAGTAMYGVARPYAAFAAAWAGCLFALIHARDGLLQTGQRDFFGAVLLIAGVACLMASKRAGRSWLAGSFGGCVGAATMVKPTLGLFLLLVLVDSFHRHARDRRTGRRMALALAGWLLPVLGCVAWVAAKGSLREFWYAVSVVAPYHAAIGHAPAGFLWRNSLSPLTALAGVWLVVRTIVWSSRGQEHGSGGMPDAERHMLLFGAVLGYVSYLIQQRGYPYHRYPLQAFLLMLMAVDFTQAIRSKGAARWMSAAALLWAAMVFAPVSAVKAGRYEWPQQPFRSAMQADLSRIAQGRGLRSLDGKVQCLDSISGCVATLDAMRVVQSTGLMYDEFLFNPPSNPIFNPGGSRVVENARADFLKDVEGNPPLVFVVSEPLFPSGPDEYGKLDQWPEFRVWLAEHYALDVERKFTIAVRGPGRPVVPPGYRMYVLK